MSVLTAIRPARRTRTAGAQRPDGAGRPGRATAVLPAALGAAVAADGPAAHDAALADLARRALAAGVDPVLCAVVADRSAPAVARERALGRIAVALAADPDGRRVHPAA
jgi:hypothetical protein